MATERHGEDHGCITLQMTFVISKLEGTISQHLCDAK